MLCSWFAGTLSRKPAVLFNTEETGMKNAKINPEKPNLFS